MLSASFQKVYDLFKMNFYSSLCENSHELNMQEAFSLDIIHMLGNPTILEFAETMGISQPNATYKINQMIEKGYLTKTVSKSDKRSYHLHVTEKFIDCYRKNDRMIKKTLDEIENIFTNEETELLNKMLESVYEHMKREKNDDTNYY